MNYRKFCVVDLETTSANPNTTQPLQLAAVMVDGRKLEIIPGSEFQSLIAIVTDKDECARLGLDPLEDGAVAVHGKTEEILSKAPPLSSVWANFVEYVNGFNYKGSNWTAPIMVGYNIKGFDSKIIDRICCKAPYNLGPVDKKRGEQDLFNRIHSLDMLDFMFALFENDKEVNSLSADNLVRNHMGYDKGKGHDAMEDVIMTAELFCRTQKMLRTLASKKNFKGSMKTNGAL